MKVYLAAPYIARNAVRKCADELELIGMHVTSKWLNEQTELQAGSGSAPTIDDHQADAHCRTDFADIAAADVLVVFTGEYTRKYVGAPFDSNLHSGGRHVETGYALAKGKRVIVIGDPENIFHRARRCTVVPDWHRAVLALCKFDRTPLVAV